MMDMAMKNLALRMLPTAETLLRTHSISSLFNIALRSSLFDAQQAQAAPGLGHSFNLLDGTFSRGPCGLTVP